MLRGWLGDAQWDRAPWGLCAVSASGPAWIFRESGRGNSHWLGFLFNPGGGFPTSCF